MFHNLTVTKTVKQSAWLAHKWPFHKIKFMYVYYQVITHTPVYGLFSGTTQVSRYQNGKTNLDFTEATDSEWQWHHLGHMQVCTLL